MGLDSGRKAGRTVPARRRVVAPWPGDEHVPYLQGGVETVGGTVLWLSGTGATRAGVVEHVGDVTGQAIAALERTGTALHAAGYAWREVVRLNWYVTSRAREQFTMESFPAVNEYLDSVGCKAAGVLLYVDGLALSDMLCEFEATAVKDGSGAPK